MRKWFKDLNIQGKLFFVFSVTILIAMLSTGMALFSAANIRYLTVDALRIYARVEPVYQARLVLQKLNHSAIQFLIAEDPYWLAEYAAYDSDVDIFLREMTIAAADSQAQEALQEIERSKRAYSQFLQGATALIDDPSLTEDERKQQLDLLIASADEDMENIYDNLDILSQIGWDIFVSATERLFVSLGITTLICVLAIVLFFLLAFLATSVTHNLLNQPAELLAQSAAALKEGRFEPAKLEKIASRNDETGRLAREFIHMASAVEQRQNELRRQAEEIRAKIR